MEMYRSGYNGSDSKSVVSCKGYRGFESHRLRQSEPREYLGSFLAFWNSFRVEHTMLQERKKKNAIYNPRNRRKRQSTD